MIRKVEEKLSLDDVMIMPEVISSISSRTECNPYLMAVNSWNNQHETLPIFTAPMNTVVDENTYQNYIDNKIIPIIPRTVSLEKRMELLLNDVWVSVGLTEFKNIFLNESIEPTKCNVLIDIANGHMASTLELIAKVKSRWSDMVIMAGNIANPKTIVEYCKVGVDYVRVGIGGGSGCTTSSNTGIHYPMASLIKECYEIREEYYKETATDTLTFIVADGGMKNYDDINKALGLGADFVMCGGIFASTIEAPGDVYSFMRNEESTNKNFYVGDYEFKDYSKINKDEYDIRSKGRDRILLKEFYGMSTKKAQSEMGKDRLTTSEGVVKNIEVKYSLSQWVENYTSYLTSAMSYTNSRNLYDFIGKVDFVKITNTGLKSFND